MNGINTSLSIAGRYGSAALMMIIGYLLYDKNRLACGVLIAVGVFMALAMAWGDHYLKDKKMELQSRGCIVS